MSKKCQSKNAEGKPCQAPVVGDTGLCFWHGGRPAAEVREAQSRGGGKSRTLDPETVTVDFSTPQNVTGLLANIAGWVLTGQVDARVANAAALCCSTALRGIEAGELERRIAELERRTSERRAL